MSARCSDPTEIGCKNPRTPGFNLQNSPHRQSEGPCQSCRSKLIALDRARLGKPPIRRGRSQREAL